MARNMQEESEEMQQSSDAQKILKGLSYPATKEDIITQAEQKDADSDLIERLNQIPDMDYKSASEVYGELDKLVQEASTADMEEEPDIGREGAPI